MKFLFKISNFFAARTKQLAMTSGGGEGFFHGHRGSSLLGLEYSLLDISSTPSSSSASKELRRIGKIRMTWEESVSLWGEEGEVHRGRVRLQSSNFLNADELACFDDSMVPCPMEYFEDGPLKGFSVDRFVSGQQVKVFGRRKSSNSPSSTGGTTKQKPVLSLFFIKYNYNYFLALFQRILGFLSNCSICVSLSQVLVKESNFPPNNHFP